MSANMSEKAAEAVEKLKTGEFDKSSSKNNTN